MPSAHNALLTDADRAAIKAHYPALRARARETLTTGIDFDCYDALALETPAEERARVRAALAARRPLLPRRLPGPDGGPGGERHGF